MKTVRLNDPVQVSATEVSTIAELDAQGRITWRECEGRSRRSKTGVRTAYFAVLNDNEDGACWEVGKLAYLSRTKQPIEIT